MLINPALGRLRQDRIFKTCGLVLSKCHRGEREGTENTVPSRKAEEHFKEEEGEARCPRDSSTPVAATAKCPHRLDPRLPSGNLPGISQGL